VVQDFAAIHSIFDPGVQDGCRGGRVTRGWLTHEARPGHRLLQLPTLPGRQGCRAPVRAGGRWWMSVWMAPKWLFDMEIELK